MVINYFWCAYCVVCRRFPMKTLQSLNQRRLKVYADDFHFDISHCSQTGKELELELKLEGERECMVVTEYTMQKT